MSLPIVNTWANPDPLAKPTTLTELIAIERTLLTSEVTGTYLPYVVGQNTPAVEDQDKVWHRLDSPGRPAGTYLYYNGMWVREAPSQGALVGYFVGDPTVWFDGTGLGLPGPGPVSLDFFGWALMNGNNGTANLSDKFIILGRMDNVGITGYAAGWRTNVNGVPEAVGGVVDITSDATNTYRPATDALNVGRWEASGMGRADNELYGSVGDGTHPEAILIPADAGNPTPPAIPTVPPFIAFAMIQWLGYP